MLPTEKVETVFIDEKLITKVSYTVYRLKVNGGRVYYTIDENGDPVFALSLTTLTKSTLPTSPFLIKWISDKGYDEAQRFMNERAAYGSLMHCAFGELVIQRTWNPLLTKIWILEQINKNIIDKKYTDFIDTWADDINCDVASFAQCIYDYKIKPIAIELVMVSKDGFGTMCDFLCKMTILEEGYFGEIYSTGGKNNPKGSPKLSKKEKEITALWNFKSGRKGFYEENEIQLSLEQRLFQENFPNIKIDRIYNFSPKEWRDSPTYNLKDQTDSLNIEKAEHLLAIAKIELFKKLPSETTIDTEIKYGEQPTVKTESIFDIIKLQHAPIDVLEEN